jgi:ankyrin repeat protein
MWRNSSLWVVTLGAALALGGSALTAAGPKAAVPPSATPAVASANSTTPVADAAMVNETATVKDLLEKGEDVNSAQHDGMTALHWAALNDNADMATMLLYAGADANAATRLGGYTPLDLAARDGHADMVKTLLAHGADAKRADFHGTTPLMFAAQSGDVQEISDLLTAGAEVNAKESTKGETALMLAAAHGRTDAVKLLLSHGADWKPTTTVLDWTKLPKSDPRLPHFRGQFGQPLQPAKKGAAAEKGAAKDAAAKGPADTNAPAKTADAKEASAKTVAPPDPNAPPPAHPKTMTREMVDKMGMSQKMTDFRGEMGLVHSKGGLSALLFAARQGYTDTAEALLAGGADINEVDPGDHTSPLLMAIINGHYDLAKYFLAHGADANAAQSNNGVTPLYAVLNCEWAPKAEYPQPTAYGQQQTSYLDLMSDLLAHGANPNARLTHKVWYSGYNFDLSGIDETGATPFWRAAYADDINAMKLLVAHGADPNLATKKPDSNVNFYRHKTAHDYSGLKPVPAGGPDIPPLLAASGEAYGSSLTSNSHRFAPTGMLAAVKYLVEDLHVDVNARDADGNTALHNAASRGDNAMILYLVSRGANITAVNRNGQTVADMANGPVQRIDPFPQTIALVEHLGAKLMHKCLSCGQQ